MAKAKEITRSFGYNERPVDTLYSWSYDIDYLSYARQQKSAAAAPYPPAVFFWCRQSPRYPVFPVVDYELAAYMRDGLEPGIQSLVLSSDGDLLQFIARSTAEPLAANSSEVFDWSRLFTAAGLDSSHFHPAQPQVSPTVPFDTRAAWTGSAKGNDNVRVEAAAYEGRLVLFRILGPWARPGQPLPASFGTFSLPMFVLFLLGLPLAVGIVAWHNSRSGRGDRAGAWRLAAFAFFSMLCNDLAGAHHVADRTELIIIFAILRYAIFAGCLSWISYMALEPQLRRRSPESLISWNRLLAGRFRDPMVGSHLAAGVALGILSWCAVQALVPLPFAATDGGPALAWAGASPLISLWFWHLIVAVAGGVGYLFLLTLVRIPVRQRWLAASLFVVLLALALSPGYFGGPWFAAVARPALEVAGVAIALTRLGLLAAVAAVFTQTTLRSFPLTTNLSAWYADWALIGLATVLAVALYGFATTLRGRPMGSAPSTP